MNMATDRHCKGCQVSLAVEGSPVSRIPPAFVAVLAHEIRNVLSPLSSSLELLNIADLDEIAATKAREVMGRQLRYLRRLVDDLLDTHRIEHHQVQIVPQLTELSATLEAICEDHRPVYAAHGIALELEVIAGQLWVNVDADRLDQVMKNLLNNSLKFTNRGGKVRLGLFVDVAKHCAVISVHDTGIGIEPTEMPAIFDPHARDSSKRNASGVSLGLPLVKCLVELHGGTLTARSDGGGRGAEFCIFLPLLQRGALRARPEDTCLAMQDRCQSG